jgi:transcriptional regulator with XRE-family HTH domain
MDEFPNNVNRLRGLHALTARETSEILHISPSTIAKWGGGLRKPSFGIALKVGDFFGVRADRLATAEFIDLLQHELADPERFEAVESRIHHARAGLRAVERPEPRRPADITKPKSIDAEKRRR